jgi:CubicO group peptidase (beta-lactamase class C family)
MFCGAQSPTMQLDRRVDSVFAAFSLTSTPGCAVGIDTGGAPLVRRAYGMANLETSTPFTLQTRSESGSTAKQFVAAGLVMLALDGVLSLNDDISRWIPEVKGVGKRITVRQLLSHTSGLPDRYTLHDAQGRAAGDVDHTNAEVLDIVSRLRELNFDPGEDYLYSNTGYVVAVAVLERASGKSLQTFSEERIFRPLGMTRTHWREDHRAVVSDRASAYTSALPSGYRNDHPFTRVFGSGGLLITIDDFLRWSNALQSGPGAWSPIRDSLEAVIRLNDGTAITYGLGVSTDEWRGVRRVSHTGATGGYRAALFRYPAQDVSVAILCNVASANTTAMANRLAPMVLGDALQPIRSDAAPALAMMPDALQALSGRYRATRTNDVVILQARDGRLVDSLSGRVMEPFGGNRFRVRGTSTFVEISGSGATATLTETSPNTRTVVYAPALVPDVAPAALAQFAGRYTAPEIGGTATLIVQNGVLMLDNGWRGTTALRPLLRDVFATPDGERLFFTRDSRGRVTGYAVWAGRVRHLRFDRTAAGGR